MNVVDDYSRECVGQLIDVSISGQRLARYLDQLAEQRSLPKTIVCDNRTEPTSKSDVFLVAVTLRKAALYSTSKANPECVY